jgi:WhiB family transcriptional regulator, redox-sensing transcriptional regulator
VGYLCALANGSHDERVLLGFWELVTDRIPAEDERVAWRLEAACRDIERPEVFFPRRGDTAAVVAARAVCATCPVSEPCLRFALAQPRRPQGVWGGTTERERRRIRVARTNGRLRNGD